MKRVLVINIARMGDLIHSTPLMQGLREQGYEVTLLYSDGFKSIAPLLAGPHHLIPIRLAEIVIPLTTPHGQIGVSYRELSDLVAQLREPRFDLAVNITHTRYSAGLTRLINARDTLGMTLDNRGSRQIKGAWASYYFNSILNRNFNRFNLVDLHRLTGGVPKCYPVKLTLPAVTAPPVTADSQLSTLNSQLLIGLVPGASTPEKRWPVESFTDAITIVSKHRPIQPVILGAPGEKLLTDRLAELLPEAVNLGGKTDVPTLADVISKLDLLVTNDTGPMHIAAAVGTKVVDVTLGSAMAVESAPYGTGHFVIEPRISCFSCLPKLRCSHLSCHRLISPSIVASVIETALNGDAPLNTELAECSTVKIYRTAFDNDGLLTLEPLNRVPETLADVVSIALRVLWKWALNENQTPVQTAETEIEQIRTKMTPQPLSASPAIEDLKLEFRWLEAIATKGKETAQRISILGSDARKVAEVKTLGRTLSEIDEQVAQLAYSRPELMPLVAQFTYAKQSIDSTDLTELATQTAKVYNDLLVWSLLLPKWIDRLSGELNESPTPASQLSTLNS